MGVEPATRPVRASTERHRRHARRWHPTIDARSSVHPIHTRTSGLEGFVDLSVSGDGASVGTAPAGHLSLPVVRLRSGNPLEDRELRRRIDARRFPTIDGELTAMRFVSDDRYLVAGQVTFRGETRACEEEMTVTVLDEDTMRFAGRATFDVRDFGMEPPRILMLRVYPEVDVSV